MGAAVEAPELEHLGQDEVGCWTPANTGSGFLLGWLSFLAVQLLVLP